MSRLTAHVCSLLRPAPVAEQPPRNVKRVRRYKRAVKTVTDGEGNTWSARTVILVMGSAYRRMGLPDESRLAGHGVSWCATCDGFFFRDQDIVVVGGGDSAVEEATFLTKFARSVTIVHRRDELRASKIMAERAMSSDKIQFAWYSAVEAIHGQDKVTGVDLRDTLTGDTRLLPVTGVFVAIGHDPRNELVKGVVDLDTGGYVQVRGRSSRLAHGDAAPAPRPRFAVFAIPWGRHECIRGSLQAPSPPEPGSLVGQAPLNTHRLTFLRSWPSPGASDPLGTCRQQLKNERRSGWESSRTGWARHPSGIRTRG